MRVIRRGFCVFLLFFFFLVSCSLASEPFHKYAGSFLTYSLKGQAGKPTTIAADSKGRIFTVVSGINEVRVFDPTGKFLFSFGQKSSQADNSSDNKLSATLVEPSDLAIDKQDQIYVTDLGTDTVLVYGQDGKFKYQFIVYQPEGGRSPCVPFIAYNPHDNRLYLTDACNHQMGVYTLEGKYITAFGSEKKTELSGPANLSFDAKGNIYIVDSGNFRIASFSPEYKFRFAFGKTGTEKGSFIRPYDMAIDAWDRIYVSDFILNAVQVFTSDGKYLDSLAQPDNGQLFRQPLGLTYSQNKIWVVNAESKGVISFGVSR